MLAYRGHGTVKAAAVAADYASSSAANWAYQLRRRPLMRRAILEAERERERRRLTELERERERQAVERREAERLARLELLAPTIALAAQPTTCHKTSAAPRQPFCYPNGR